MGYAPATPVTRKNMEPNAFAWSFMGGAGDGPFTLRWDADDWCCVFKGRKKVWSCNGTFAREHFSERPATQRTMTTAAEDQK